MIDKTTVGVSAEPEEVEAVLHNLCGYHLAERDPVFRYTVLTREQVLYDALVAAIKRERGRALAELVASGTTLTNAAQLTNLTSRQQVQRLIAIAKAAEAAAEEVQAASRDFEERMAAVEATLDEVVSGILPPAVVPAPPVATAPVATAPVVSVPVVTVPVVTASAAPAVDAPAPVEESPVDSPVGAPVASSAADPVEVPAVLVEATQALPALAAVIHPTRDVQPVDDSRWWRRGRDSGAA